MRKEIAEKWAARLRSPEAKQAHDVLGEESGSRCCLGVLCDIYAEENPGTAGWGRNAPCSCGTDEHPSFAFIDGEGGVTAAFPTSPVVKWAGMSSHNGEFMLNPDDEEALTSGDREAIAAGELPRTSLAGLNDSLLWDFPRIADMIDKYWEKL